MSRAAIIKLGALAGLAAFAALAACDAKEPEPSGVGKWRFGHTTLADANEGICQPTDLRDGRKGTWCFAQTPFKIARSVTEVDAYFAGSDKTTPLAELQLKVRGCHEDEVEQWMRASFGVPIENKANRVYWKNSFVWAAAMLPSEPGRCVIYFLPIADNGAIALVKQL